MNQSMSSNNNTGSTGSASDAAQRQRVITGLRDKISTLMNRMEISRKELKSTRDSSMKLQRGREAMERQLDILKEQIMKQSDTMSEQTETISEYQQREKDFRRRETEIREKTSALRRQQASGSNDPANRTTGASFGNKVQEVGDTMTSGASGEIVKKYKNRIRLLETQLSAYKSDASRTESEKIRLQDQLSSLQKQLRKGGATAMDTGRNSKGQKDNGAGVTGQPGASHAEWAAQKRLRQRADTLAKRLRERTEELDIARKQVEHSKTQLTRVNKEKSELATRISNNRGSSSSKTNRSNNASSSGLTQAVSSLQTGEEARKRIYELEQRCSGLTRVLEVEKEGELRTLRTERDALSDRYNELEKKLEKARRKIQKLETMSGSSGSGAGGKTNDGAMYLRSSEDRFREQEEIRSDLSSMTTERNQLEGRLLERDNLIMELRFDVEASTTTVPLLERRVRELETSNRALASQLVQLDRNGGRSSPSRSGSSSITSRKAGERFKRERDLEGKYSKRRRSNVAVTIVEIVFTNSFLFYCLLYNHSFQTNPNSMTNLFKLLSLLSIINKQQQQTTTGVIESQNRVIMKMQTENERLTKRGVSASKIVEAQKELRSLRRRNKEFELERKDLLDKAAVASSAKLDVSKTKDLCKQLKRKLNKNEQKTNELRRTCNDALNSKQRIEEELQQANVQLSKAEKDVERLMTRGSSSSGRGSRSSGGAGSENELKRIAEENDLLSTELTTIKSQLQKAERELSRSGGRSGDSGSSGRGEDRRRQKGGDDARVKELEDENSKLRSELESFDLEFFEEVEDLKYKYAQAKEENKRLKDEARRD